MAKKISELTTISSLDSSDVLPIVDVSANTTNKVTSNNLVQGIVGSFNDLTTTDKTSIVNAINEIKTPVVLYNNTSGSNAEITLSDSSANYEYIEIFYRNNNSVYSSLKVYQPNGKSVLLPCNIGNSGNQIWVQTSTWSISATNVSPVSTRSVQLSLTSSGVSSVSNTNQLYITRIIGYK